MISNPSFVIKKHDFNKDLAKGLNNLSFAIEQWPIVYILSDGNVKVAYVGETTDAISRMNAHLNSSKKSKLAEAHFIESKLFNKSATLDIESNLIKYISGDGQYQLLNGNIGLANHNYYQKDNVYWGMFTSIWDNLRSLGISKHSIEHINNSDLFKYSPYKSLSTEQLKGLSVIIDNLINGTFKSLVMQGGAGTGKTILAVFLFKLLNTDLSDFNFSEMGSDSGNELIRNVDRLKQIYPNPKMALVVPMSSFRKTLKNVFSKVKGLKSSMVVGPAEIANAKYDIVVVDEAHRLRRRVNLGAYFGAFDNANEKLGLDNTGNELDWIRKQSNCAIYFYDESQSIKPSDVSRKDFEAVLSAKDSKVEQLTSQFRVRGGNGYVKFVTDLLNVSGNYSIYSNDKYEVKLFDSIADLVSAISEKDSKHGLSRMIAGYSWEWVSKKNAALYDIEIDNVQLKWNSTNSDWINSTNAVEEVGCIHTTQGYDLNYAGIIFGHEIGFDKDKNQITIDKDRYFDKNGKQSVGNIDELKDFILNIYKTILLRGIRGTFIYACDPGLRAYIAGYLPSEKIDLGQENKSIELIPFVNSVPFYEVEAAAGAFSDTQNVQDFKWIAVPSDVKPSKDLFACKVVGESMNRVIPNGSICLFRKYNGGSRNGRIVLVQSNDIQDVEMGGGYTVKEYFSKKMTIDGGWKHESIVLKPISYEDHFKEIVLDTTSMEDFKVIGVFERVMD